MDIVERLKSKCQRILLSTKNHSSEISAEIPKEYQQNKKNLLFLVIIIRQIIIFDYGCIFLYLKIKRSDLSRLLIKNVRFFCFFYFFLTYYIETRGLFSVFNVFI